MHFHDFIMNIARFIRNLASFNLVRALALGEPSPINHDKSRGSGCVFKEPLGGRLTLNFSQLLVVIRQRYSGLHSFNQTMDLT